MAKSVARDRYARIIADGAKARAALPSSGERRGAPRVALTSGDMTVNVNVAVSPLDVSVGGACFFAERAFDPGSRIEVSVASVFTVPAVVVGCAMEESGSDFLEVHYRVRCKFEDEDAGMELLVFAKERERVL